MIQILWVFASIAPIGALLTFLFKEEMDLIEFTVLSSAIGTFFWINFIFFSYLLLQEVNISYIRASVVAIDFTAIILALIFFKKRNIKIILDNQALGAIIVEILYSVYIALLL